MSNDELNKAIYEAVLKESTGFFEHIDVPDGTYTASALAKLSDNNELNIDPDFNASEEVYIHVNRFKCSFLKKSLFHMLKKFEKLANIKNKYLFSKLSEKDVPVLVFNMDVSSAHKSLINAIDETHIHSALTKIYLDYKNSKLVASDGYILMARHIDIREELKTDDLNNEYIYLTKEMLKHANVSQVKFYKVSEHKRKVVLSSVRGDAYSCTYDVCQRFPYWERTFPYYTESGCFRFSESTVNQIHSWITMCCQIKHSSLRYPYVRVPKNFHEIKHWVSFYFQSGSSSVRLVYKENDVPVQQLDIELEHPSTHTFLVTLSIEFLQFIPDWNGTVWIASNRKPLLFDTECKDDSIIIGPIVDGDIYDIQGESFPYSERHLHLPTSTQPIEINNQETIKTPVQEQDYTMLMATVNKTQKRYSIDSLIEGEYEIREQHHDPDLVLAIRSMAHYLKGDKELQVKVIKNFEQHYGCPKDNPDYFLNYPLPELELATRFSEVFEAEGIYDIPDYPSAEPSSVQQHESVPEEENNSSIRSGLVGGKNIIPIMTLETSQGPMIISTYDSFSVLDASDDPRDHELIDRIDAFISSATFNADPLDMEAIASEMEEFFNLVEAEGHAI